MSADDPLAEWRRREARRMARDGVEHPDHHAGTAARAVAFARERLLRGIEDPDALMLALSVVDDLAAVMRAMAGEHDEVEHRAVDEVVERVRQGKATGPRGAEKTNRGRQPEAKAQADEICRLVAAGASHKQVADMLTISTKTVQRAIAARRSG